MITIHKKKIDENNFLIKIKKNNINITFFYFLHLLKIKAFVLKFKDILLSVNYDFYFETSCIKSLEDTFVIVLVKTHFHNNKIDLETYKEYFKLCSENNKIVSFDSLTTTRLICPCPESDKFTHFRNFLLYGSIDIIYKFFYFLSDESNNFLKKNKIIYLKTHGHAVNYFHFRLQYNEKLYSYKNFSQWKIDNNV